MLLIGVPAVHVQFLDLFGPGRKASKGKGKLNGKAAKQAFRHHQRVAGPAAAAKIEGINRNLVTN